MKTTIRRIPKTFLLLIILATINSAQIRVRTEINVPDILGYKTLKCDFHIHTVFSDGSVWPDIRPEEAWREGLDAIAITDHIEYLPHKDDVNVKFNRSHEIAKPKGDQLDIIVIKGGEITRRMPPGHFNAIFINDVDKLEQDNWRDAFREADKQNAFIFWNHPGWTGQRPDGIPKWFNEHSEIFENNWMDGIEVVNTREYYPEAHQWCIDKNITMLSNSDIHNPLNLDYNVHDNDHRPLTFVFAKARTAEAIKEALLERRTAVYWDNNIAGNKKFLEPIFYNSVSLNKTDLEIKGKGRKYIQIKNTSDINYELELKNDFEEIKVPKKITLWGNKTVLLSIGGKKKDLDKTKDVILKYEATNLNIAPHKGLPVEFKLNVTLTPTE